MATTGIRHRHIVIVSMLLLSIPQFVVAALADEPAFFAVGGIAVGLAVFAAAFDRWWAVLPAAVGAAISALHTAALYTAFGRIDSGVEFGYVWTNDAIAALAVVFACADLVARKRRSAATVPAFAVRGFGASVAAILALVAVSAVLTAAGRETVSASDRTGAIELQYEHMEVSQQELAVSAGETLRLVVDNEDMGYHDFVIEGTDIKLELGPKESKLAVFRIDEPGAYTFRCTVPGHGKMKGVLAVQ